MKKSKQIEPLLTVADVMVRLRAGREKVEKLIDTGKIPSYRIERSIRVKREELENYIDSQRIRTL